MLKSKSTLISFDDFQSLLHIENKQKLTPIHIAVGNCNFEVAHLDIAQDCHKRCDSTNKQTRAIAHVFISL